MKINYWHKIYHSILILLGIHVWGEYEDITPDFWHKTFLSCRLKRCKCQNCDLTKERGY